MFTSLDLHPTDATKSYGGTQDNGTQRRIGNSSWTEFSPGDGGQTVMTRLTPASFTRLTLLTQSIAGPTTAAVSKQPSATKRFLLTTAYLFIRRWSATELILICILEPFVYMSALTEAPVG
jgi:hypothetical protein